jgi:hypothetical protein
MAPPEGYRTRAINVVQASRDVARAADNTKADTALSELEKTLMGRGGISSHLDHRDDPIGVYKKIGSYETDALVDLAASYDPDDFVTYVANH